MLFQQENEKKLLSLFQSVAPEGMGIFTFQIDAEEKTCTVQFVHPTFRLEFLLSEHDIEDEACLNIETHILMLDDQTGSVQVESIRDQLIEDIQQEMGEWAENTPTLRLRYILQDPCKVVHKHSSTFQIDQKHNTMIQYFIDGKTKEEIAEALETSETDVMLTFLYISKQ